MIVLFVFLDILFHSLRQYYPFILFFVVVVVLNFFIEV